MKELRIPRFDILRFDGEFCAKDCPQKDIVDLEYPCLRSYHICKFFDKSIYVRESFDTQYLRCEDCLLIEKEMCSEHAFNDDYPIIYK